MLFFFFFFFFFLLSSFFFLLLYLVCLHVLFNEIIQLFVKFHSKDAQSSYIINQREQAVKDKWKKHEAYEKKIFKIFFPFLLFSSLLISFVIINYVYLFIFSYNILLKAKRKKERTIRMLSISI